jgi:hypothetical protein
MTSPYSCVASALVLGLRGNDFEKSWGSGI